MWFQYERRKLDSGETVEALVLSPEAIDLLSSELRRVAALPKDVLHEINLPTDTENDEYLLPFSHLEISTHPRPKQKEEVEYQSSSRIWYLILLAFLSIPIFWLYGLISLVIDVIGIFND